MELSVRELRPDEIHLRIDYFHGSTDEHLRTLGVDRARLPDPATWSDDYAEDYRRPLPARQSYALGWELDGDVVGFSSLDRIAFGDLGYMHLHIIEPGLRGSGLGALFVRLSADRYFELFELRTLRCEPNAFNVAPNRSLQRAGFRYQFTHECVPGPLNFPQPVTRWELSRPATAQS